MPRRLPALGVAAVVTGFAVILGAWLGARDLAYIDQQFPALVAGGLAGLALVMLGAAALVVDAHRRANDRLAGQLSEAVAAAARGPANRVESPRPTPRASSARTASARAPARRDRAPRTTSPAAPPVDDTTEPDPPARVPAEVDTPVEAVVETAVPAGLTRNGTGNGNGSSNGHPHGQTDAGLVVPRRTLFHDPECRLVSARTDTETIGRADAVAAGLAACRICRP